MAFALVVFATLVFGCSGSKDKTTDPVVSTGVVGVAGGTITTASGLELVFPPLAVDSTIDVTVTEKAGKAPGTYANALPKVRFEPSGKVFAKPVRLRLPVPEGTTNVSAYWSSHLGTGYFDTGAAIVGGKVELEIVHFSEGFVATGSGVRSVNGSRIVSWTSAGGGVQNIPADLTTATLRALVPDGAGGFTTIEGTGHTDGTFEIPDVPNGGYWLQLDDQYVFTTATTIDLGYALNGRPAGVVPAATTAIDFDLGGMSPWMDGDTLELYSTEVDTWYFSLEAVFPAPAVADTRLVMQVDTTGAIGPGQGNGYAYPPGQLIQGSLGDRAVLAKLSARTTADVAPVTYLTMDKILEPPAFDQTDGGLTSITGNFTDVALSNAISLDLRVSQFDGQASACHPDALTPNGPPVFSFYVNGHPGGLSEGAYGSTADFLALNLPSLGGDVVATDMDFGTPLTGLYGVHGTIGLTGYFVPYQLPTTVNPGYLSAVGYYSDVLSAFEGAPVVPPVGNVGSPLINGNNFQVDQFGVGTTPTLSWTAPTIGPPTLYRVDVWHFFVNGSNNTGREVLTTLTTTATSMQIPPGVLTVGESYAVKIRAIIQPLPESAPYRKGFPDAQSVVLSSRFVP